MTSGWTRYSNGMSILPYGANLGLTRSFQSLELFEDMTVAENILVGPTDLPGFKE